jgi:hypothetical protein
MMRTFGVFAAGIALGWLARSTIGASADGMARLFVATDRLREDLRRFFAEQRERIEDAFAEGRAACESVGPEAVIDDDTAPVVRAHDA